ncbi:aldehyde-activating protein [Seohaeicola zhoushanensis]|uniref:Aldehyde-activating protein n=2 Tax=Seohaeicola zhoushanensis TaxID=1569283 RepID=A0A8J3GWP2_9RHOB|nr:aldehyde-activating protein [Seohaeicola zhoushanensis]
MPAMSLPATGHCRCGALQVRVTKPPMLTAVCHCTGCQRMSGSAFSTTAMIPVDGFEVVAGEHVVGGLKGDDIHHQHCPDCLSWVFTTFGPERPFVNLRAVMLEDPSWFTPFIETCTAEKLPWAETGAPHSYEAFPPPEAFGPLLAEFAALPTTN